MQMERIGYNVGNERSGWKIMQAAAQRFRPSNRNQRYFWTRIFNISIR
jgi:hypothetical protein